MFGLIAAIRAKEPSKASVSVGMLLMLVQTGVLPYILPSGLNSALSGAGSTPFVTWLSLVSFREVRGLSGQRVYPALEWIKLDTAGGPFIGVLTCLIGIIGPASPPGGSGTTA